VPTKLVTKPNPAWEAAPYEEVLYFDNKGGLEYVNDFPARYATWEDAQARRNSIPPVIQELVTE